MSISNGGFWATYSPGVMCAFIDFNLYFLNLERSVFFCFAGFTFRRRFGIPRAFLPENSSGCVYARLAHSGLSKYLVFMWLVLYIFFLIHPQDFYTSI